MPPADQRERMRRRDSFGAARGLPCDAGGDGGFHLKPVGFFKSNPALDLPRSVNTASKLASCCNGIGAANGHANGAANGAANGHANGHANGNGVSNGHEE